MKFHEITRDVYIADYQLTEEAAAEAADLISDNTCPVCRSENYFKPLPKPGRSTTYICNECGIRVTIDSWEVEPA